jgi:hypothetical protein
VLMGMVEVPHVLPFTDVAAKTKAPGTILLAKFNEPLTWDLYSCNRSRGDLLVLLEVPCA